jgi:omega-6 fatty acid desaturase (delta-12 desaturase)
MNEIFSEAVVLPKLRSGKALILATKAYAKENRKKSWYYMLSTFFLLLLSMSVALFAPWFGVKLVAGIIQSLMIARFFVIYHDYLHHTILQKSFLANAIMTAFGIYMLAPKSIWKRSHDYHHSHNSKLFSASIGSYPIATVQKYKRMSKKERIGYLAMRHPITVALGYFSMFMFGMSVNSFMSSPKRHLDSLLALVLHAIFIVAVVYFLGWQAWLCAIMIPFSIACGLGAYLFYAQHNFPSVIFKSNEEWAYETAALQSSSYMTMSKFGHWVTANIGYHHIHHLNSRIPFYRLPEAMEQMPELRNPGTTSLSIKDVIACFKLKVWDPESQKMIPVPKA